MSELGHEPTFAACQRNVWNATVNRHSAPNFGNAPVSEPKAGIASAARMQASGQDQVKNYEIWRWGSDNENGGAGGQTPGGGVGGSAPGPSLT
jgi:hypothetical protein